MRKTTVLIFSAFSLVCAADRKSRIGTLDKAWDEAIAEGWTVVSLKDDWKTIFPK